MMQATPSTRAPPMIQVCGASEGLPRNDHRPLAPDLQAIPPGLLVVGRSAALIALCARMMAHAEWVDRIGAEGSGAVGSGPCPEIEAFEARLEAADGAWR